MGYKRKPVKGVLKRFKITKTGKVKRHHAKTSHLMSARPPGSKRRLRRPAVMAEGMARRMRSMVGKSHLNPLRTAHEKAIALQQPAAAAQAS